MNCNESANIFNDIVEIKNSDRRNGNDDKDNLEDDCNENRILYKLSLRKQKLQEKIYNKRDPKIKNDFLNIDESNKIIYEEKDFLSGKLYDDLDNAFQSKDEKQQISILFSLVHFLQDKKLENLEYINLFKKTDSSSNIKNNISNEVFPIGSLVLKIGLATGNKIILIYCFNFILNFSYISHEYCLEITKEKIINDIFNKLIYFYPFFVETKNKSKIYNKIFEMTEEKKKGEAEAYYVGGQILKLFGNLLVSSDNHEVFKSINFYEKVIYLLSIFELDMKYKKYLNYFLDYLDTLIWLIYLFLTHVDKIIVEQYDNLINIIPNLLSYAKDLYDIQQVDFLEKIIELIEILSNINENFAKKIAYSDGIKILSNLFDYLFAKDKSNCTILSSDIVYRILSIFINITAIDSQYLRIFEYDIFAIVFEKLFSVYKFHHSNHFDIQENLILILSNFACVEDVGEIIKRFLMNSNIIKDLFKIYYQYHKKDVLNFINNVMIIQHKKVRDFIVDMGAFDIMKNNICDFSGNSEEVINLTIQALFNMIQREKAFNIRLLFSKLYETPIPDKIKEIFNNSEDFPIETEKKLKSLIEDFENYEKTEEEE